MRIELGHVEAMALKVSGVQEAQAVAAPDSSGMTRVVLFTTPLEPAEGVMPGNALTVPDWPLSQPLSPHRRHGTVCDSGVVMADLSSRLPSVYMPALAVTLAAIPTLPNGKVDGHALKAMATKVLLEQEPADSISRTANTGSKQMPGWYYAIMQITLVGMCVLIMVHIVGWNDFQEERIRNGGMVVRGPWDPSISPPSRSLAQQWWWQSWFMPPNNLPAQEMFFFAAGYYDLVGLPPRTWRELGGRIGVAALFYVAWMPLQWATRYMDYALNGLWPVLGILVFRLVCLPVAFLAQIPGTPWWARHAVAATIAAFWFFADLGCTPTVDLPIRCTVRDSNRTNAAGHASDCIACIRLRACM